MLPVHEEGGNHLLYYMVSEDPVTMHMDKTIRDPDRNQFIKALGKELRTPLILEVLALIRNREYVRYR